jgi:hypothetical protein
MKKNLLIVSFCLLIFVAAFGQPELTKTGLYDDFSTKTDYSLPGTTKGIYWWTQSGTNSVMRDTAKKQLMVHATQAEYQYVPFGLSFGTENGALATVDLSKNGKWSFDITNYGTENLFLRVACQDIHDTLVDCNPIPNAAGVPFDNLNVWAYQVQISIPIGKTVTFKAGTPNDAGAGNYNNCDFANGVWGDYGTWDPISKTHVGAGIRTNCNLAKIKSISFTPMNASKNSVDQHALPLLSGLFGISNLRVGTTSKTLGMNEVLESNSLSVFPNPAKNSVTIRNPSAQADETVSIINHLGQQVYFNHNSFKGSDLIVDTSGLHPGIYFIKIGTKSQKLIIENN